MSQGISIRELPAEVRAAATDPLLSWRARGVIAHAILKNVPVTPELIISKSGGERRREGAEAAAAIINELVEAGYASRVPGGAVYLKARITPELREAVYDRDGHRCVGCQSIKRLSVDHVIPESKGGKTELDNLQTLCLPCNVEKGASA